MRPKPCFSWVVVPMAAVVLLGGCAPSVTMVGKKRPSISKRDVVVASHKPEGAELIAVIRTEGNFMFNKAKGRERALKRAGAKAAGVGANVICEKEFEVGWQHVNTGPGMSSSTRVYRLTCDAYYAGPR